MVLSRIFQSGTFLEVMKVIWHPNRGLSCNSRGNGNPAPKSNHTASTLAPPTTPDWHLKVPPEHLDKPLHKVKVHCLLFGTYCKCPCLPISVEPAITYSGFTVISVIGAKCGYLGGPLPGLEPVGAVEQCRMLWYGPTSHKLIGYN